MHPARLISATLAFALSACGHGGPGGTRTPTPLQSENAAAFSCRILPYAAPDGTVSRTALDSGLRAAFGAADSNADGWLQKDEIGVLNKARASSCDPEPVIDWDGAGRMSYPSYAARTFTLFDRMDLDGDAMVTPEEIQAAGRENPSRDRRPEGGAVTPGATPSGRPQ